MVDEVGRKLASLGASGAMFAVAASIAGGMGLAGAAVITTALAMLGGPFGMLGGITLLVVAPFVVDAIGKFGIEAVLVATYRERRRRGETYAALCREIDSLWISDALRQAIKRQIAY
jgi:hypothetical protein